MTAPFAVAADRWAERRRRAEELAARWPFAGEVLGLYGALVDVQERVYRAARTELTDASRLAAYAAERALPMVARVTAARGPEPLARAAAGFADGAAGGRTEWEAKVETWLDGGPLPALDRYFARAAAGPVLEALGVRAGRALPAASDGLRCPHCGGLPQASVLAPSGEDLVAPRRFLECSRCAWRWSYPRMTCPACGESDSHRLPVFGEEGTTQVEMTGGVVRGLQVDRRGAGPAAVRFPHITIYGCTSCSRYLLNVDLSRDTRAVPVVDELAAVPLDLYARERAMTKIAPNLMGF